MHYAVETVYSSVRALISFALHPTTKDIYYYHYGRFSIRRITPNGAVLDFIGSNRGSKDGQGVDAMIDVVLDMKFDSEGELWFCDYHKIRKANSIGEVTTICGSEGGFRDGPDALLFWPNGIALDNKGGAFICDTNNHRVRQLHSLEAGTSVETLAGSESPGHDNGIGPKARFDRPTSIIIDQQNNLIISDRNNHCLRIITPDGTVSTLAGGTRGFADGKGANACFFYPRGVCLDGDGNILVADFGNNRIRLVTPQGVVTTLAGGEIKGSLDGNNENCRLDGPFNISMDRMGTIYFSEPKNKKLRRMIPLEKWPLNHSTFSKDIQENIKEFAVCFLFLNLTKDLLTPIVHHLLLFTFFKN